ncbi:hypothetical protein F0562_007116 [Nyssa sinensis]|uniref:Exoribonuclease phosphorolytic domain-containing protein n=1 Tax=Nyssa sinensis TaxID=561372 RepID=A0A5J5A762_9ASTE|nr:hypothetical protein F0562_007116 [Nyssa sinensis]
MVFLQLPKNFVYLGETKVLAAVYGPKAGTKKNENPEKACIEVIWKPKTGQIGKPEKEYEMILKRTLQSICLLTVNPNTTTSVIVQVVNDDGALLPCAINAACAALVDAGIPLKHLAVAICCCLAESGYVILDPNKLEEQKMKAFVYLVFPNSIHSVLPEGSLQVGGEPVEHGIITSVTHGVMSVDDYLHCLDRGRAPLLRELQQVPIQINVSEIIKSTSVRLLDGFVDLVFEFVDQPLLPSQQSNFAPVEEMGEAILVTNAEGKIPDDFPEGVYIRNGPNPLFGALKSTNSMFGRSSHIWVEGEGMLHALYFNKDSGNWTVFYNNRYVHTETLKIEKERNKPSFLPAIEGDSPAILSAYLLNLLRFGKINKYISNTNVFEHSGKCFSVAENHLPQEIDILSLGTLGNWDVNGAWNQPAFTSHPKKVPGTGELVIMGVDAKKPYLELGVISADGKKLVHKVDLKFNRSTLCHDIGITERYNVLMDFPLTIDIDRLIRGGPLIRYDKEGYARIGVMPRYGDANSIGGLRCNQVVFFIFSIVLRMVMRL